MKDWQNKEKNDAKAFEGRRTPRSGGLWGFKGDVTSKEFLIESKLTSKKAFNVTKELWDKIYNEAIKARKRPILSIQIQDREIVILDKDDFLELYDLYSTHSKD